MSLSAAGFVIFRRNGGKYNYLLLQASDEQTNWSPPKGFIESGETTLQTAYRETLEETSLQKSDIKILFNTEQKLEYKVKGQAKEVCYWLVELVNEKAKIVLSSEHINYKWVELKEALKLIPYKNTQDMFKYYDVCIKKHVNCEEIRSNPKHL